MTIDTVAINSILSNAVKRGARWLVHLGLLAACFAFGYRSYAGSTTLTPWVPVFKGIDHAVGTNIPGANAAYGERMVVHIMRVNLQDPDIKFLPSPRIGVNYVPGSRETAGYTTTQYLRTNQLQLAINANFFNPQDYYLPAGTPMDASGLVISHGVVVSPQSSPSDASSLLIDGANHAHFVMTNWPPVSTAGISNAVSGQYPILIAGVNVARQYIGSGEFIHQVQPRTCYGLSQDKQYLFLMTIDGRQPGYSDGALDWEGAAWMVAAGAYDAVNMDGGGSTTLVMQTSTGGSVDVNHSSAIADSGKERTVGAHFGINAKPVPGVINDVVVVADDDAATVTWSTINPATTQVEYGVTTDLGSFTPLQSALVTNHAVLLTNLIPNTDYYFRALSTIASSKYASSNFFFTTSNYITTNIVVDLPSTWSYTVANLDRVNWTAPDYNDSVWEGSGPGLLMVDIRGLNPDIQPQGTTLPVDPSAGEPYVTYYFRTHFSLPSVSAGTSLVLTGYIDDGAVAYLNGHEISRLRMDDPPTAIVNSSLATTFPCDGDATCLDTFVLPLNVGTNLVAGDNVLAVEVHNYNPASADITFGVTATVTERIANPPKLLLTSDNSVTELNWSAGGYLLQQSSALSGPWTNTVGPVLVGPYRLTNFVSPQLFYRLQK